MGYKLNGCDTGGVPMYLIKRLLEKHTIHFAVETGTANGDSARAMSKWFEKVWTIELIEDRAELDEPNVVSLVGDSVELLPEIIDELKAIKAQHERKRQWVLFYLDAHYSGDTPNESEYPECPVEREIEIVAEYGEDAIIIIDDARLFFGQPPHPHDPTQWPSVCDIFILLREKFPYHHITIVDDYIICVSHHLKAIIDEEWRERFKIRYPNDQDKLKTQVKDVYAALKNYLNG